MFNKTEFKKLLLDKQLNYESLAKEMKISKSTLVRYVNNGFNDISLDKFSVMQKIFGAENLNKAIFFE